MPKPDITPEFVQSVAAEISRQLSTVGKASRVSVAEALGIKNENVISSLLKDGKLPAYKLVRKVGIVPVSYQTAGQKRGEESNRSEKEPLTDITGCDV